MRMTYIEPTCSVTATLTAFHSEHNLAPLVVFIISAGGAGVAAVTILCRGHPGNLICWLRLTAQGSTNATLSRKEMENWLST